MKITSIKEFNEERRRNDTSKLNDVEIDSIVLDIIRTVREKGDESLFEYTKRFDGVKLEQLPVSKNEFSEARDAVSDEFYDALSKAKSTITEFHEVQMERTWLINQPGGITLGQKVTALDSVGIYVPGGKAVYPSTVLMNALPAKIAGVGKITMVTPPQADGKIDPHVLVAAMIAGVDTVYKIGGAQAIAALAYGTETIEKVMKITGPGNAYVARAKKWVFGDVAIDMIAGPSEICVLADETANPIFVAADLLSQAEHDEQASAICVTTSQTFAYALQEEVNKQLVQLERREIAEASIKANGRIILVDSINEGLEFINELAPEHLQVMVENPMEQLATIRNAGAIFLGNYSPEAIGDYIAGPNHTLPTNGTAAFSSPLGVYDFLKKSSIIQYTEQAFNKVASSVITLAEAEGLTAHANSIKVRKGVRNA